MGQQPIKAGLEIRRQARLAVDQISSQLTTVTDFKALTYEQFLNEIQLLNKITDELTKNSDKTVLFSVLSGPERKLFWKVSTKIVCEKVQRGSREPLSSKLLSVRRFMRLYSDIRHQLSAVSTASYQHDTQHGEEPGTRFSASIILDGIDSASICSDGSDSLSECCICLERECQVILRCTHGYCEPCIQQWSTTSNTPRLQHTDSTCPLCRDPVEDSSLHWVLPKPNKPTSDEMPALVLGLVDRAEGKQSISNKCSQSNARQSGTEDGGNHAGTGDTVDQGIHEAHLAPCETIDISDDFILVSSNTGAT